jgi:translation elongation factor P/translation initiation factor 5A
MKNRTKLTGLFICLLITASITAQTRVNASKIMNDIKNGKDVAYKNATIVGVLDFTFMESQMVKLPKRKKRSWWNKSTSDNKIEKQITSKVSFENCTFEDNVFAYIHEEDTQYTFVANFEEDAVFKNCTFNEMGLFKYSKFDAKADFSNTKFKGESTFKYADFKRFVSFSNTSYEESSTFKYAVFRNNVSFANSIFKESATFKYAQFKNGVSFNKTRFEEDLNIKYTKVNGDFNIAGMHVEYEVDSKYTRINGKSFHYN